MKWRIVNPYHSVSECGRYVLAEARKGGGLVTYYATRNHRGSHVIGIERDIPQADEAACTEARVRLRRLCSEDAARIGAEL